MAALKPRRISVFALVVTCLTAFSLFFFSLSAVAASNALYATDEVYMRASASKNASVISSVPKKASLELLSDSKDGWAYVSYAGKKGYVSTVYLQPSSGSSAKMTGITQDELNMRSGKGTSYGVVSVIPSGKTISVSDNTDENWAKVTYSSKTGYVSKSYLLIKISKGSDTSTKPSETTASTEKAAQATEPTQKTSSTSSYKYRDVDLNDIPSVYSDSVTDSRLGTKSGGSYKLILDRSSVTLKAGKKTKLTVIAANKQQITYPLIFTSSNSKVATVASDGTVTAVSKGTAKITVTSTAYSSGAVCEVTVTGSSSKPAEQPTEAATQAKPTEAQSQITISQNSVSLYTGNQHILTAKADSSVTWSSSNSSVASVSSDGIITAKSSGTAKITAKTKNASAECNVTVTAGASVNISHASVSIPIGKTFMTSSSASSAAWKSSDASVASVDSGMILAKKKGKAVITVYTSKGASTCLVTVIAAEPVRFAYSSPNCAAKNSVITLYAVTDTSRTGVKFDVISSSSTTTVKATSHTTEGDTYVWKGSVKLSVAGTYKVTAYSQLNGVWSTCDDAKTTAYVVSSTDLSTPALSERRPSDNCIAFIAQYEGYLPSVYIDTFTGDPTLGYGKLVYTGDYFYNSLTKTEAYAYLTQTVNNEGYSSKVNSFLIKNNIKFNQQQFDALVCFVYNTGTGVLTADDDLYSALTNCADSSTGTKSYYINATDVNFRKGPGTNYTATKTLSYGTELKLLSSSNPSWYYVQLSSSEKGYVCSDYVSVKTIGGDLNLNYVKKQTLINKFCQYHHAGGSCVRGLLNRRLDEMEIFFYNDYKIDYGANTHSLSFTCAINKEFTA